MVKKLYRMNSYSKGLIINKDMLKELSYPEKFKIEIEIEKGVIVLTPVFDNESEVKNDNE